MTDEFGELMAPYVREPCSAQAWPSRAVGPATLRGLPEPPVTVPAW